jgi:ferredoxin
MIAFEVEDLVGEKKTLEIPEGISLSLMEVLKASEYAIAATCGGLALCATCHVDVTNGFEQLPALTDAELDMIDTLPNATSTSRLACQIKLSEQLNGASFKLMEASEG